MRSYETADYLNTTALGGIISKSHTQDDTDQVQCQFEEFWLDLFTTSNIHKDNDDTGTL